MVQFSSRVPGFSSWFLPKPKSSTTRIATPASRLGPELVLEQANRATELSTSRAARDPYGRFTCTSVWFEKARLPVGERGVVAEPVDQVPQPDVLGVRRLQ